jgi:pimeloyl-ACP methyl ester carboxylesterase
LDTPVTFADIRGASLFYTDDGAGDPTMVFVHGFSCDSHDWTWQLPHFRESHRVIALDLRGHGRSSVPDDGYEVGSFAADVAALLDHLGCRDVVAVGHSLGGAIVASLAAERPDLVRAVVAVDPGHLIPNEAAPMLATALAAYETGDPGAVAGQMFDAGSHVAATPAALATWHNRRAQGMSPYALRKTMAGLLGGERPFALRSGSEDHLRRVGCPVLSLYVDPARAEVAEQVFAHPLSRAVCFEGSGHWLHQERPTEVNALIDAWLGPVLSG